MTDQPDTEALERATLQVQRATLEPIAVAAENAQLRSAVAGSHAIIHALVKRLTDPAMPHEFEIGDPVVQLDRDEWQTHDPREELKVEPQDDGSVRLYIHTSNRAQRRAAKS